MSECSHKFGHMLNIEDGTGYYMCSLCEMEITEEHYGLIIENQRLRDCIIECLNKNGHLADGENCTLIDLKRAVPEWELD
jgi:hypothetical protein